jgi:hypothetical protein
MLEADALFLSRTADLVPVMTVVDDCSTKRAFVLFRASKETDPEADIARVAGTVQYTPG